MLEQLLPKIRAYRAAIFRRWWLWILLMASLGGLAGWIMAGAPTLYTIRTSFVPEAKTGVANPLAALMSAGGMDLGGPTGSGNDMMIGVILSARIRRAIAADSLTIDGKRELASAAFMRLSPPLKSLPERLGILTSEPVKDPVTYAAKTMKGSFVAKVDKYGYIEVLVTMRNRALSAAVTDALIKQISIYYRDQKTEKARYSLQYFNLKIDSVVAEIDQATFANAHYLDRYKFSPYAESFIPREKAVKKADYLQAIYSQLLISREQAVAQLLDETPVIQVLDQPEHSETKRPPIILSIVLGCLVAMCLVALINAWSQMRRDIAGYLASLASPQTP